MPLRWLQPPMHGRRQGSVRLRPMERRPKQNGRRHSYRLVNVYNGVWVYTSMRTNIVIDDKLMRDALRATGLKTKREAVEEGLRTLLRLKKQAGIRRFRGKLDWHGDLDAMRSDS